MWPSRNVDHQRISTAISQHGNQVRALPGAASVPARETLSWQFVASMRREDYYRVVQIKDVAANKADPNSGHFDAERAVAFHMQQGNVEEAAWLVFLMTHFARPADTGWLRLRDVYGRLGQGVWDWATVSANPQAFANWVYVNAARIRGKFGNHRKYESLRDAANRTFLEVLQSYVTWIGAAGHRQFFATAVQRGGNDPRTIFDALYRDMAVVTFGRLAKFDYLSLIGRYGIAPIVAGSAYLAGATGPTRGCRLLFTGSPTGAASVQNLQGWLDELDRSLNVGMAVMEDALCNWQKSPTRFVHYVG